MFHFQPESPFSFTPVHKHAPQPSALYVNTCWLYYTLQAESSSKQLCLCFSGAFLASQESHYIHFQSWDSWESRGGEKSIGESPGLLPQCDSYTMVPLRGQGDLPEREGVCLRRVETCAVQSRSSAVLYKYLYYSTG